MFIVRTIILDCSIFDYELSGMEVRDNTTVPSAVGFFAIGKTDNTVGSCLIGSSIIMEGSLSENNLNDPQVGNLGYFFVFKRKINSKNNFVLDFITYQ